MTAREYAKHRGITPGRVSQYVAAGKIKRRSDGKIDSDQADRDLEENLDKAKQRKKGPGHPVIPAQFRAQVKEGSISEAQARTLNYLQRAKKTELELKKMQGQLLDKSEVEEAAFNAGRQTRDSVVGLVERKGDEWHLSAKTIGVFEFKLKIRRDLEEALKSIVGENGNDDA